MAGKADRCDTESEPGERVHCEVAWAEPNCQRIVAVALVPGANAFDALEASGLLKEIETLARTPREALSLGVFSRRIASPPDYRVREGDRIEIYRSLLIDPKQARRDRSRRGR